MFQCHRLTEGFREMMMKIVAVQGDIAEVDVDAVVNPADATSRGIGQKGGKARRPRRLSSGLGEEVESEAVARGPVQVGEAMLHHRGAPPLQVRDPRPDGWKIGFPRSRVRQTVHPGRSSVRGGKWVAVGGHSGPSFR